VDRKNLWTPNVGSILERIASNTLGRLRGDELYALHNTGRNLVLNTTVLAWSRSNVSKSNKEKKSG
jgi:hypothetical protein